MIVSYSDFGLEKVKAASERVSMDLEDDRVGSWAEMVQVARKESQSNQNTH